MASTAPLSGQREAESANRDQIRTFIADTFFVDDFSDDDSFLQTGIIDSNGMMALVVFIEGQFAIRVEDAELLPENLDSVDNLIGFISRKQGSRPRG